MPNLAPKISAYLIWSLAREYCIICKQTSQFLSSQSKQKASREPTSYLLYAPHCLFLPSLLPSSFPQASTCSSHSLVRLPIKQQPCSAHLNSSYFRYHSRAGIISHTPGHLPFRFRFFFSFSHFFFSLLQSAYWNTLKEWIPAFFYFLFEFFFFS